MTFQECVGAAPALAAAHKRGLGALRGQDRERVICSKPRALRGSIDLDQALRGAHPQEPRLDYVVGISGQGANEIAFWIGVHAADSHHVADVIRKFQWTRGWAAKRAQALYGITPYLAWVATGRVSLRPGSPQRRRLASAGIVLHGNRLDLSFPNPR